MQAPESGYFDLVEVPYSVRVDRYSFYDVNARWLASSWPEKRKHLLVKLLDNVPRDIPQLMSGQPLPDTETTADLGTVDAAEERDASYRVRVNVERPSYLLFKMTYHPNWKAVIDGRDTNTVILSPGFVGIPMTTGEHSIEFRYDPGRMKYALVLAGLLVVGAAFWFEKKWSLS